MTIRNQYIKLRQEGWTYAAIARKYGVSYSAVRGAVMYRKVSNPKKATIRKVVQ